MKTWRISSTVLAGAFVALFAGALLISLIALLNRQESGVRVTHEGVVWAVSQAEFELIRLYSALDRPPAESPEIDVETLRLRADILWSRLDLIRSGDVGRQLDGFGISLDVADRLKSDVDRFAEAFPASAKEPMRGEWAERFHAYFEPLHKITVDTNLRNQSLVTAEARTTTQLYYVIAGGFVGVVLGGALLVSLQARAARREQEASVQLGVVNAMLNDAIESIPGGFALFDKNDRFVLCNSRYKVIYPDAADLFRPGVTFEEIVRSSAERAIFAIRNEEIDGWVGSRLEARSTNEAGMEQQLSDGRWILAIDKRSRNGWTVGIRTDITDLKNQERELAAARDRAEAASRSKSNFLAMMSHEIRTPMNGVLGTLELLSGTDLTDQQRRYQEVAERSARDLLTLLDDILDLSKMDAGRFDIELMDFGLAPMADSVVGIFQAKAKEKNINIRLDIDEAVPRMVRGDPGRLRQVLLNLVGNAVKFTERGAVTVKVSSREVDGDGDHEIRFEVTDTGIGIPKENWKSLFQEFTQLDSSYSRRFGGTGLGLSICKKLVEMMGGEIGVTSTVGEGSTFWVRLVMRECAGEPDVESEDSPMVRAGDRGARILLAEDSEVNQMVAREILERAGHSVDVVSHGIDAVNRAQSHAYDVILMDVSMPQMDGIEATLIIRSMEQPGVSKPIVAMTAHTRDEDRRRCEDAGMTDFLSKPIKGAALLAMVAKWTDADTAVIERNELPALPASDPRPEATLDEETLRLLERDTSPEAIPALLDAFKSEIPARLAGIEKALADGDLKAGAAQAHPLKSSAGAFGCLALQDVARDMETHCQNGDADGAELILPGLKSAADRATDALDAFLDSR